MASVSMRQMLEAGVHFGHQTRFWNPKMAPFIFGERNKIHIINLEKTLPLYARRPNFIKARGRRRRQGAVRRHQALGARRDAEGSRPLRHALRQPALARRHAHQLQDHPPVDQAPEGARGDGDRAARSTSAARTKRRRCAARWRSCRRSLGGIKEMDALPDALFVIDVGHEKIAVHEARKLGIPVVAVVDTNCSPDGIDYVDPRQRRRHARHPAVCASASPTRCSRARSAIPEVPAGEDEFVELDEEGNAEEEGRAPQARAAAPEGGDSAQAADQDALADAPRRRRAGRGSAGRSRCGASRRGRRG